MWEHCHRFQLTGNGCLKVHTANWGPNKPYFLSRNIPVFHFSKEASLEGCISKQRSRDRGILLSYMPQLLFPTTSPWRILNFCLLGEHTSRTLNVGSGAYRSLFLESCWETAVCSSMHICNCCSLIGCTLHDQSYTGCRIDSATSPAKDSLSKVETALVITIGHVTFPNRILKVPQSLFLFYDICWNQTAQLPLRREIISLSFKSVRILGSEWNSDGTTIMCITEFPWSYQKFISIPTLEHLARLRKWGKMFAKTKKKGRERYQKYVLCAK